MNRTAGWAIAAAGVALALVGIWLKAFSNGLKYWDDGTIAALGIALAALAALLLVGSYTRRLSDTNGPLFAIGAVLLGFWGWYPAATAFDDWDQTRVGMWLTFAGAALLVISGGVGYVLAGGAKSTRSAISSPALASAGGVVLAIVSIFLNAIQGSSYWDGLPGLGHSLGLVMLAVAALVALTWAANLAGVATRGLDAAFSLVLLGLMGFAPVAAAFGDFGTLDAGAWLGFAGGILAAGGTWAARGGELPHAAAMPA